MTSTGNMRFLAIPLSAILFVLALPPAGQAWLGWIALAPALALAHGRGFARGFAIGLAVLVLSAVIGHFGLIYRPGIPDGDPGWTYGGFGLFGVAVGLTFGVFGEVKDCTWGRLFVLAAWSVLFEALLLTFVPGHVALTQARTPGMLALASATGIWGVSYLLWLSNMAVALAWRRREFKPLALPAFALVVALVAGAWLWRPERGDYRVGALQTTARDIETLSRLNAEAGAKGARVVVWPEGSAEQIAPRGSVAPLRALAANPGQPPIVAGFEDDLEPKPHNCASLFTGSGESSRYFKRRPFGAEPTVHTAGKLPVTAKLGDRTIGFAICFDTCFPSTMREAAQPGVEFMVVPTMDPISPFGIVQGLHAAYLPFRAAETGLPMVRSDTSAFSSVVDARGFVVAESGCGTEESLTADIRPGRRWTLYSALGDWFLWLCGGAALAAIVRKRVLSLRGLTNRKLANP